MSLWSNKRLHRDIIPSTDAFEVNAIHEAPRRQVGKPEIAKSQPSSFVYLPPTGLVAWSLLGQWMGRR